jgi:hypothetical protein
MDSCSDEEITITSSRELPPDEFNNYSPVFKFGPDGLVFNVPVEISIEVPEGTSPDAVMFWSKYQAEGYDQLESRLEGGKVFAAITHFSSGFVGDPIADDGNQTDAGEQWDAGSPPDAGTLPDAGTTPDGGFSDGGTDLDGGSAPDAGTNLDGGFSDGGTDLDGGSAPDAG